MFWITEDALRQWKERNKTRKRGKPKVFSDTAIEVALTLRAVFHLPLRQTEGCQSAGLFNALYPFPLPIHHHTRPSCAERNAPSCC
ncbi:MAG: Transposase [Parcubacteria group bacterium GW2011_GWF2_44_17]|nr:MAG: Transposase [Parcubacteria group bacterium GW2011_GWF2_44_17]